MGAAPQGCRSRGGGQSLRRCTQQALNTGGEWSKSRVPPLRGLRDSETGRAAPTKAHGCTVAAHHPGTGHLHGECRLALCHEDAAQHAGQLRQPLQPLQPLLLFWLPRHLCQLLLRLLGPDLWWARSCQRMSVSRPTLQGHQALTRSSRAWDTPFRAAGGVAGGVAGSARLGHPGLLGSAVRRARSLRAFSICSRSGGRSQEKLPPVQLQGGSPPVYGPPRVLRPARVPPRTARAGPATLRPMAESGAWQAPTWGSGRPLRPYPG